MGLGFDNESLLEYLKSMQAAILSGKHQEAYTLLERAIEHRERTTATLAYLKLAAIKYIGEDEDPYVYNEAYNLRKIEDFAKDKEVLAFFLKSPFSAYTPTSDILNEDTLSYFQEKLMIDLEAQLALVEPLEHILKSGTKIPSISSIVQSVETLQKLRKSISSAR